jgi:energy-coupling factor transporter ATP-binding protein EcfA2
MDFFQISSRDLDKGPNKGALEVYPDFVVGRSQDLMVRGKAFYAIWDQGVGLWSRDEYDVQRLIDLELDQYAATLNGPTKIRYTRLFNTNEWSKFRKFMSQISDNSKPLDEKLTFANTDVKKNDYVSRRLPYNLAPGDISAWNELIGTLYSPEERAKIEWAIGAVISGDSTKIQKFLVLYGPAGTGKSTVLNIISKLFDGYTTTFEAKALASNGNTFATEAFRNNPLVAIQHDGDLSRIEDNSKINSIISHEMMTMNEKYKPQYDARSNAFLLMGTNQPVKISDAKSGIIRRLIDVQPSGEKIPPNHYHALMAQIDFELGAIAHHCLQVYRGMGKNYYNTYRPLEMMFQTDIFFNFVEAYWDVFKAQDGTTLKQAYALYKEFCNDTGIDRPLPQYKVRSELQSYFKEFHDRHAVDGVVVRSYYSGFTAHPFKAPTSDKAAVFSLVMDETSSILDLEYAHCAAQLAKEDGTPAKRWSEVKTTLAEIDTSELHYVRVPDNHIVIDFDLRGDDGTKSLERNLESASEWPASYAELSRSGAGVHLHYLYDGDTSELASSYSDGIEVKVYTGNSSLRRRLSKCNNVPISTLTVGQLPVKEKKVLPTSTITTERGLRQLIARNLRKEIHPGTKPSIDFIAHILKEAYLSGMEYDVTDLRPKIIAFANNSSNQPLACLKVVQGMYFQGSRALEEVQVKEEIPVKDERLVFFDVECYSNLFVVCWKFHGDPNVVRMINPSPKEIEGLFKLKLVSFFGRNYDNHMLWARFMGYNLEQLYKLSQKLISGVVNAKFGEAYHLSYTDVYDFASKKQGLKKWQIELGIHHKEMDIPWDQPVPQDRINDVVEYCVNDVVSLEAVFEDRKGDYAARLILAELSGLTPNHTTQQHTAKIIFGDDQNARSQFVYTDLSKEFPGYDFDSGKSLYRDEIVGEGGYVHAEPGMYSNVALLDVASMHPTSIGCLRLFGDYTPRFTELVEARLAIKSEDYETARRLLDGRLVSFLGDPADSEALAYALKIVVNIVYGLTSAKFENPFRDHRNKDNIVAKRGALFMIDLKHYIQSLGFSVAHIKTDSVKIPDATPEIIEQVKRFGEKYGYTFEHEATYSRFCLVNDAVYVAKVGWAQKTAKIGTWVTVGAQFQHPYVRKTLFTHEDITFDDLCETKQVVQGAMYLDFDHSRPLVLVEEMHFVGRTGRFVPVHEGNNGGVLYRVKDGKQYAVTGTKGFLWLEADVAKNLPPESINMEYFERLATEAREAVDFFGPFSEFTSKG